MPTLDPIPSNYVDPFAPDPYTGITPHEQRTREQMRCFCRDPDLSKRQTFESHQVMLKVVPSRLR
jgi:hypothetical protein